MFSLGTRPQKRFANPVLGRKKLKNMGFEGRQIINLPGGAYMFEASPDYVQWPSLWENLYKFDFSLEYSSYYDLWSKSSPLCM
jgi:hypothetical protein